MRFSHLFTAAVLILSTACASKEPQADYPQDANSAREIARLEMDLQKAKARQYDILAPRELDKSEHYLGQARSARAADTNLAKTWQNLSYARGYYDLAEKRIREREANAKGVLEARAGALNAGARRTPEARKMLADADKRVARNAEDFKDVSDGKFRTEMEKEYREIEVKAVQEARLGEARRLIYEARDNGASLYAPRAMKQTYEILAAADRAIEENPRREDAYKQKVEDAVAAARWLTAVNASARAVSEQEPERVARGIVSRNERMAELREELRGTETEAMLNRRALAATARDLNTYRDQAAREREFNQAVATLRGKLSRDEADVYRDGDRLLVQLKRVGFQTGSAEVPNASKPLLTKVKSVLEDIKPKEVVVQGHADATGSEKTNERISSERAHAVADMLNDVSADVEVQAFADKRPIRTNKTTQGRAANRRVDLIIVPGTVRE